MMLTGLSAICDVTPPLPSGYFMESLIHAREWIVGATLSWVVEDILDNYVSCRCRRLFR